MTEQLSIAQYKALGKRREPPKALTSFKQFLQEGGFGELRCEFTFHPTRKWRFDFAFPDRKIAFEYDGLMQGQASHASINGILRDVDKTNAAQELGWKVYRVNAKTIGSGEAYSLARRVLEGSE